MQALAGAELRRGREDPFAQLRVVPALPRRFDFGAAAAGGRGEWRRGYVGLKVGLQPPAAAATAARGGARGDVREAQPRLRTRPIYAEPALAQLDPLPAHPRPQLVTRLRPGRERNDERGAGDELDDAGDELELLGIANASRLPAGEAGVYAGELVAALGQYDESWEPARKSEDALRRLALHAGLDRELRPGESASSQARAAARGVLERSSAQVISGLVLAVQQLERRLAHASGPGAEASRQLESGACVAVARCIEVLLQQHEQGRQGAQGAQEKEHEEVREQRQGQRQEEQELDPESLQQREDSARDLASVSGAALAGVASSRVLSLSPCVPSSGSAGLDAELRALRSAAQQLSALHSSASFNPEKELAALRAVAEARRLDAERARADLHAADRLIRELKGQVLAGQAARLAALEEHHTAALVHADNRYRAVIGRLKRDKDALTVELRTARSRRDATTGGAVESPAA